MVARNQASNSSRVMFPSVTKLAIAGYPSCSSRPRVEVLLDVFGKVLSLRSHYCLHVKGLCRV